MHISLLTATGAYNLGDELILRQEYEYLKHRYSDAIFTVFTYDRASSLLPTADPAIRYISYFPNNLRGRPFANICFFFKNLYHIAFSDLVVIGGGGLIYDNESWQSFAKLLREWKIRISIAKFFRVPVFYWSLGIHVREENIPKLKPLFTGATIHVSVRDIASKRALETLDIKNLIIYDPVLLYDPGFPKLWPKGRPKIGLSFRSGYLPDELKTIEQIITFLQKNDYELIFLNHSFHPDDNQSNDSSFLSDLAFKYHIASTRSMEETLSTYKELDFVVGMRLHSLILSLAHNIPFFAISYWKKTDEFIRSIGYEFVLAARNFHIDYFKERFLLLAPVKKEVQFALVAKNDTIKREICLTLNEAFHGLEKTAIRDKSVDR